MQRSSVSFFPSSPNATQARKESALYKSTNLKSSEIRPKPDHSGPSHFLTANSVTNLPLIRFRQQKTDDKENSAAQQQVNALTRSQSYTKQYLTSPSTVFKMANMQWTRTSNVLKTIEFNKKKKLNREIMYIPNQPVDSGIFVFFERKNFERCVEKSYTLAKNSFMVMKINCNRIELPVTFKIKPETSDIHVSVAFNDENCETGSKFRSTEFVVDNKTSDSVDNIMVKILAYKEHRFTIRMEFSMKSWLTRHRGVQGDQGGGEPQPEAHRHRGHPPALRQRQ